MITVVPLLALLTAPVATDAPALWVASVSAIGLSDEETAGAQRRVAEQLEAAHAATVSAPAAEESCLASPACLAEEAKAAGAGGALSVRLVRGGPVLQISTVVVDTSGAEWFREENILQAADLPDAKLLPAGLIDKIARAAPATPAPPPAINDPATATSVALPDEASASAAPRAVGEVPADAEPQVPVLGVVGLGITALGLVGGVVGAAMAVAGNDILNDPGAAGEDKAAAQLWGPAGIGIAVVGGVLALAGAVTAGIGLATAD